MHGRSGRTKSGGRTGPSVTGELPVAGFDGVTPPRLIPGSRVPLVYPELAQWKKFKGSVVLLSVLQKDGGIRDLRVLKSTPADYGFEQAAVRAVRKWMYKPSLKDGKPAGVSFIIVVEFKAYSRARTGKLDAAPPLPDELAQSRSFHEGRACTADANGLSYAA